MNAIKSHPMKTLLTKGQKIYFGVFKEGTTEIEIQEAIAHELCPEFITIHREGESKLLGYIPYEWVGFTPVEAVEALRDRAMEKVRLTVLEAKKATEESLASCAMAKQMREELVPR